MYAAETQAHINALKAELTATQNALKRLIRMYMVDDQAWNTEQETNERFTRMIEDEKSNKP